MKKRVVITGIGIIAPNGIGKEIFWNNTVNAKLCLNEIERFDASRYLSHFAGEIKDFRAEDFISMRLAKKIDRFTQFTLAAVALGIKDSILNLGKENRERIGVMVGNCLGGWEFAERELRNLYMQGASGVSPFQATAWFPPAPQGQISILYGLKGYSKTIVADRASGNVAIGYASRVIADGMADIMFAGGSEAPLSPYGFLCCCTSGFLSNVKDSPKNSYKPFDKNRKGMAIGEGSAIIILEELEHAIKRDARIYAEVGGYGWTSDGYDVTKCNPDGKEWERAIKIALDNSNMKPENINYICADGSSTEDGDKIETNVIKKVFGENAYNIPVSAPKSMIGNLLGASASVDVVISVLAINHGIVPPTVNYEIKDAECDLNYVPNKAIKKNINNVLINSRGQGGVNTALIIKRFKEE